MKRYLILILLCFLSLNSFGQDKPVKIVFDVTSSDVKVHQSAMRHVKAMAEAYPDSQFELVVYSGALDMVLKEKSSVAADMQMLAEKPNISFVVCAVTMKAHHASQKDLIPGVKTVPDGILEIAHKHQQGWSYIKEQ
ncbi:MAG: DsrE family protein [Salegentibacter sp.]